MLIYGGCSSAGQLASPELHDAVPPCCLWSECGQISQLGHHIIANLVHHRFGVGLFFSFVVVGQSNDRKHSAASHLLVKVGTSGYISGRCAEVTVVVIANDDSAIREAAFTAVQQLVEVQGDLTSADLRAGFQFQGSRLPLINPQRGIFKPQRMQYLLSIRTVFPKPGARVWYDDQRSVHGQIYQGEEQVEYAFMGSDPNAADNRWLREAMVSRTPIIYFLGIAPGLYKAIMPTYIVGWDASTLKASIAFGAAENSTSADYPATSGERRYALREVKQRLHQASFREAVFAAYRRRCAISGLPEVRLLDAAHIVSDAHETLGQPVVANGLPLSKLHHAAFDAHLLGVDPGFRIHVSRRLLTQDGGAMLELLKKVHGEQIRLPERPRDYPDRDRLQMRFDVFRGYE